MNLQTTFARADSAEVEPLRREYLDSLPQAQVLLVELQVRDAELHLIRSTEGVCGYFALRDGALIELYLRPAHWVFGTLVVAQILHRLPVRSAVVKSYDALLLSSCLPYQRSVRTLGWLVRDYVPRELPAQEGAPLERRLATRADLPRIEAVDQDVFSDPQRLRTVVDHGLMYVFEAATDLVGFGIVRPVVEGRRDVELGIAVDRPFRNRGHAVYMMRGMVEAAQAQGLNPVVSCAVDNLVSARMGARIGFVARHALLALELERPDEVPALYTERPLR